MWYLIYFPLVAMVVAMAFIFRLGGREVRRAKKVKEYEIVHGNKHYYLDDNCAIINVKAYDILFSKELKGKVVYHGEDISFLKEAVVELNETEENK
jgi:hypothetical protein